MPRDDRFGPFAHAAVMRAIRASRYGARVLVYVTSPRAEYRRLDQGGRTASERAFTRACYRIVFDGPASRGEPSDWSLKLIWRDQLTPSRPGTMARPVALRIYPRSDARVLGPSWVRDEGFGRSSPDHRMSPRGGII